MMPASAEAVVAGQNDTNESPEKASSPGKVPSIASGMSKPLPGRRQKMKECVGSKRFEMVIGVSILVNMVLIILETDANARGAEVAVWIENMNKVLLGFYVVELLTKLYIFRFRFFLDGWNIVDFIIVVSDVVLLALELVLSKMPKFSVLRLVRLVRLARAFKAATMFKELAMILRGFVRAFAAIFWGVILILLLLTVWSILAVQIIHPINLQVASQSPGPYDGCFRCKDAFSSVFASLVTFFQTVVAGDSWGTVAVPIIEQEPISGIFFLCVLVSVSLAIMNLILAVIVDSASDSKSDLQEEKLELQQQEYEEARKSFLRLCSELDADGNGSLTKDEISQGLRHPNFERTMMAAKLKNEDMDNLFDVLDFDNSGTVNYNEFVNFFSKMRHADLSLLVLEITRLQGMVLQCIQAGRTQEKTPPPGDVPKEAALTLESQVDTQITKEPFQENIEIALAVQQAPLSKTSGHVPVLVRQDTTEKRGTSVHPEELGFHTALTPAAGLIKPLPALSKTLDSFQPLQGKKTLCRLERPTGDVPCPGDSDHEVNSGLPFSKVPVGISAGTVEAASRNQKAKKICINRQNSIQSVTL